MKLLEYALKKSKVKAIENIAKVAIISTEKLAEHKATTSMKLGIQQILTPNSYEYYYKKNYNDVLTELSAYGFTNIVLLPKKDLSKRHIKKIGSVEEVSINGNSEFKKKAKFPSNANIVIIYHDLKP